MAIGHLEASNWSLVVSFTRSTNSKILKKGSNLPLRIKDRSIHKFYVILQQSGVLLWPCDKKVEVTIVRNQFELCLQHVCIAAGSFGLPAKRKSDLEIQQMALFQLVALYCRWSAVQQLSAKAPSVGLHNNTSKIGLWCYCAKEAKDKFLAFKWQLQISYTALTAGVIPKRNQILKMFPLHYFLVLGN